MYSSFLDQIYFSFKPFKNFSVFIFDKSIFNVKFLGTDLINSQSKPPPVICAAALIRFLQLILIFLLNKFLLVLKSLFLI